MEITGKLISAFVMLILGVALIGTIASQTQETTTGLATNNEAITLISGGASINTTHTYTVTNAPTGWKADDCPLSRFVMANSSGQVLTLTTDYVPTLAAGTFVLKNTTATWKNLLANDNKTYVSYTYCGDDYLNLSWGRTILNLVGGFFAIALMLVAVALFYSIGKDVGII